MLRTLIHYWRVHLAVAAAAAAATAVLTGALLVGGSISGSLRQLTLERLGRIEYALVAPRFFRADLVQAVEAGAPAIVTRGSVVAPDSGRRASDVGIHGVDARFNALFDGTSGWNLSRRAGQAFPSVIVNETLARQLGVSVGDAVLLRLGRYSDVPRETLLGETAPEEVTDTLRGQVVAIVADRGVGSFGLTAIQQARSNAFVDLAVLQRKLDQPDRVNALFSPSGVDPTPALARALTLEDFGLRLDAREGYVNVESDAYVLRDDIVDALAAAAQELGAPGLPLVSYLANTLDTERGQVPYSMVAAVDADPARGWARLVLEDGTPAPPLGPDDLLVSRWAADDLGASVGDPVRLTYYEVGPQERLREVTATFRVAGIVALRDLGGDARLTPDYPGIQEADDIAGWDPPFPVALDRIRPRDEAYWDAHRATPKAFVGLATGRRLWATRYGDTTSFRFGADEQALRDALRARLSPAAFGLEFRAIREQGLRAASGSTDFGALFLSLSFFLIVSAALLVGLLFRLGVEQRAREIGLLLAVGYGLRQVRRRLLAEGALLAALGGLVGLAAGVAYAGLLIAALRTLWRGAVGTSRLSLHVDALRLGIGWTVALLVVVVSVWLAVRMLGRIPPSRLLAGSVTEQRAVEPGRLSRWLAWGGLLLAAGLLAVVVATGRVEDPGLAFGIGAALLVAGLAGFARWCRGTRRRPLRPGPGVLFAMAARNSAWSPGRSMLSVALVASACFVIVIVAASRHDPGQALERRDSASGGFRLVVETDVALHQDLNSASGRFEAGLADDDTDTFDAVEIVAFRFRPGDDASCLNLYQPEQPRLLGVPPRVVERGGFRFAGRIDGPDDPWQLLELDLGDGVVPVIGDAASTTWILKLGLGRDLVMQDDQGRPLRLRLVANLQGSVFQSELLMAERHFVERFPERSGYGYFLIDAPADRADAIGERLEAALGEFGFDVTPTAEKLEGFAVVQNTYLSTFQVLGGMGLLLGTVGLGIVLVRNVLERYGELATLRAIGFRRARLGWMVLAENAFLLFVGVGVGGGAALISVLPRMARQPISWGPLVVTLGVVLFVGMLSSVFAVRGALRVPLLATLKSER